MTKDPEPPNEEPAGRRPGCTWSPVVGCSPVSTGCRNCSAAVLVHTLGREESSGLAGLTRETGKGHVWTGEVRRMLGRLGLPLDWPESRRIFVDPLSDLFHTRVPHAYVAATFGVMACASQHTYQILTRRPSRAVEFFAEVEAASSDPLGYCIDAAEQILSCRLNPTTVEWPLPEVWLGVSVESQSQLWRVAEMRKIPAYVRFISVQPMLSPMTGLELDGYHWVVVGDESGPGRRSGELTWVREVRDLCTRRPDERAVGFFLEQWHIDGVCISSPYLDGRRWMEGPRGVGPTLRRLSIF